MNILPDNKGVIPGPDQTEVVKAEDDIKTEVIAESTTDLHGEHFILISNDDC